MDSVMKALKGQLPPSPRISGLEPPLMRELHVYCELSLYCVDGQVRCIYVFRVRWL